jgi:tetratricopeptide (TPR) repeat protein
MEAARARVIWEDVHASREVASVLKLNAYAAVMRGRLVEADDAAQDALALLDGSDPACGGALLTCAWLAIRRGDDEDARNACERALELYAPSVGDDHPLAAIARLYLSTVESRAQRFDEAEAHARRALSAYQRVYGESHRFLGRFLRALAKIVEARGGTDEARSLRTGADDLEATSSIEKLHAAANAAADARDWPRAESLYRDLLVAADTNEERVVALQALAGVYDAQGRADEADALYREAHSLASVD